MLPRIGCEKHLASDGPSAMSLLRVDRERLWNLFFMRRLEDGVTGDVFAFASGCLCGGYATCLLNYNDF